MFVLLVLATLSVGIEAHADEDAALRRFDQGFARALRNEPVGSLGPALEEVAEFDSRGVLEALVDAYEELEHRAQRLESQRQRNLEIGARKRSLIDGVRSAQDQLLRRIGDLSSESARTGAYELAIRENRSPWSLRMALAGRCGPIAVDLDPLQAALRHGNETDLLIALEIARRLGSRAADAVLVVVETLERPESEIKLAAARALSPMRRPEAVEPMIDALEALDGRPQRQFADELERLTQQPLGTSVDAWRRWWTDHRDAVLAGELTLGGKALEAQRSRGTGSYFGIPQDGRSILYVVDLSKSMNKKLKGQAQTRDARARIELKKAIGALSEAHSFNVLVFADRMRTFSPRQVPATPRNVREFENWLDQQRLEFGTNTYGALELAFSLAGRGVHDRWYDTAIDTLFLLSDGRPTLPVEGRRAPADRPERILSAVRRWNPLDRIVVHTILLGDAQAAGFMKKLAKENGGETVVH